MKNIEAEVTQVRRRVPRGPVAWKSRSLGEIFLPEPGPGPEPEFLQKLREAFAESERILKLQRTGTR